MYGKNFYWVRARVVDLGVTGKEVRSRMTGWGSLTLFDMGFFELSVMGGHEGPHHNFVFLAPMIMKSGTGIKLDVFYTTVTKMFMTSLLLRNYDVITCILADTEA